MKFRNINLLITDCSGIYTKALDFLSSEPTKLFSMATRQCMGMSQFRYPKTNR